MQDSSSITIFKNTTSDVFEIFVQPIDLEVEVADVFLNLSLVAVHVARQPGLPRPVDERLRHAAMDWVCL